MSVVFSDNSKQVLSAFDKQTERGLEAIGQTAEGYAKDDCPVDTGRLRSSITYKVESDGVYIGTNVEYAPAVEYSDKPAHKTGKAHFLRDAATQHSGEYKKIMMSSLFAEM